MATPIRPTPILRGKFAKQLIKSMEANIYSPKKVKLFKEAEKVYDLLMKKAKVTK